MSLYIKPFSAGIPPLPHSEKFDQGWKVRKICTNIDMVYPNRAEEPFPPFQPVTSPSAIFSSAFRVRSIDQKGCSCFRILKIDDGDVWHIYFNGIGKGDGNQIVSPIRNRQRGFKV